MKKSIETGLLNRAFDRNAIVFFLMNNEAMHVSIYFFWNGEYAKGSNILEPYVSYFMVIKLKMLFSMEEHRDAEKLMFKHIPCQ